VVSSGAIMPALAPHSMLMLQIVIRPSMLRPLDGGAAILNDVALAASGPYLGDQRQHDVFRRYADRPAVRRLH
jgi:hypothetical protein